MVGNEVKEVMWQGPDLVSKWMSLWECYLLLNETGNYRKCRQRKFLKTDIF